MEFIQTYFKKISIKRKILLSSLLITIFLMIAYVSISFNFVRRTLEKELNNMFLSNVSSIEKYMQQVEYSIDQSFFHIQNSLTTRKYLEGDEHLVASVQGLLNEITVSDFIDSIYLYDQNGNLKLSTRIAAAEVLPSQLIRALDSRKVCDYWYTKSSEQFLGSLLVYQRIVFNDDTKGYIGIRISADSISNIFNYVGLNISNELCLLGTGGTLITPAKINAVDYQFLHKTYDSFIHSMGDTPSMEYTDRTHEARITFLYDYGLFIVMISRNEDKISQFYMIRNLVFFFGFICLLFVFLVSQYFSNMISSPLIRFEKQIRNIGDSNELLKDLPPINNYSEIASVSASFNKMLQRIRQLVTQTEENQKRERVLELQALQVQITPHFMYNSLESISSLSLIGDTETAYAMSKSLGLFYKTILSDGANVIPIKKEMEMISNYLNIQSIRYRDKFTYELYTEELIKNCPIVKMTLQPLVENAIYHGIRGLTRLGFISVRAVCQDQNTIVIEVTDNGHGFSPAPDALNQPADSNSSTHGPQNPHRKGFGAKNVDERLKLHFGPQYGLTIISEPGAGTTVKVKIPADFEWEEIS